MNSIVWFRLDLRLADNPALNAAVSRGGAVIPLFIYAPEEEKPWSPGAASRWWLHQSLQTLEARLRKLGSKLIIRRGPTLATLAAVANETSADAVFWNRRYEPAVMARDAKVKEALRRDNLTAESFNAALLHEPWTIQNTQRKPFQVFTAYWRKCLDQADPPAPSSAPKSLSAPKSWPASLRLEELELEPKINWATGLRATWQPGEAGARDRLDHFLTSALDAYSQRRDNPGVAGTSGLSPHLHFGEIGPRQIWHGLARVASRRNLEKTKWRELKFLTELGWREFSHHLLFHFPQTHGEPLRPEFKHFPWHRDVAWLRAWQQGRTGFPMVDAAMRELWKTGWMHNRARMIVASFLVKDLLIPWQEGAKWFWDTLVDADLAQNTLGWQWTAGCGADAAPYFRVFNPTNQGEKFDPDGSYVRRWCPELAKLPDRWLHCPEAAPKEILSRAGVEIGRTYPPPLVSHAIAREVALEAFAKIKEEKA